MKRFAPIVVSFLASFVIPIPGLAEPVELPRYGVNLTETSASGLSSGAFMTAQLHVIHSELFKGAGIIAGGPYFCSGSYEGTSYVENATNACMNPHSSFAGPRLDRLLEKAQEAATQGLIDDQANLRNARVYNLRRHQ